MKDKDNHEEDLNFERFSSLVSALQSEDPDSSSLALRALASMDYMRFPHIVKWIYYENVHVFHEYIKCHSDEEDEPVYRMIAEVTNDDPNIIRPLSGVTEEEAERYYAVFKWIIHILIERPTRNSNPAETLYDTGVVSFGLYNMFDRSGLLSCLFDETNALSACLGDVILDMLDKERYEVYDILNKKKLL